MIQRHAHFAAIVLACVSASALAQEAPSMTPAQMAQEMQMDDNANLGMLKLDQFEHALGGSGAAWEGDAWYGGDIDKIWLRSEGEREDGDTVAHTELFWDHAFAPFWDWQLGARADSGAGPGRQWLAFGVQGLAPYWIELQATAYAGAQGRTALRLRAEYELLLTQRLILQPESEANIYGKSDPRRDIGSGVSELDFGLRLRYEIRREFAPYIGVVWRQRFGQTGDLVRASGHSAFDSQVVAGVRVWF
jgi:copper resistance protein B